MTDDDDDVRPTLIVLIDDDSFVRHSGSNEIDARVIDPRVDIRVPALAVVKTNTIRREYAHERPPSSRSVVRRVVRMR